MKREKEEKKKGGHRGFPRGLGGCRGDADSSELEPELAADAVRAWLRNAPLGDLSPPPPLVASADRMSDGGAFGLVRRLRLGSK